MTIVMIELHACMRSISHTDWKPDRVENFTISQCNPKAQAPPYVVLNWSPPINMETEFIKGYDIRFFDKDSVVSSRQVSSRTTSLKLTTPVVTPLTTYAFEVRAYTDSSEGEWRREIKHIGNRYISASLLVCLQ